MGWESHAGGGRYYYRKERRGRKVVSVFMGAQGSPVATAAAALDRCDREDRDEARRARQTELDRLAEDDRTARELCDLVGLVVASAIELGGYHRHCRGPWRRRRMSDRAATTLVPMHDVPAEAAIGLVAAAERKFLARILPTDPSNRAALATEMAHLRADLSGPAPTTLERLLVDRIVSCWLHVYTLEIVCLSPGKSGEALLCAETRRDKAHVRYLAAIRALAHIRRLRLPGIINNLVAAGGQQVNVAGGLDLGRTS